MRRSIGTYSDEWHAGIIQAAAKAAAGHKCEACGMQFNEHDGLSTTARTRKGKPIVGSCHHINHNRSDDRASNIVFLCSRCHLSVHRYSWLPGAMLPLAWRRNIPRWIIQRKLPYKPNPQLELI